MSELSALLAAISNGNTLVGEYLIAVVTIATIAIRAYTSKRKLDIEQEQNRMKHALDMKKARLEYHSKPGDKTDVD